MRASNVIDVGYSGVIGAKRIVNGQSPYGHIPVEDELQGVLAGGCRRRDPRAHPDQRPLRVREPHGDTYGPVAYEAYIPGYIDPRLEREVGRPAGRAPELDPVRPALPLGLALVGLRFGGMRLAVMLAFAWVAYPFTLYVSSSNTNDALPPLFLIWGFWLVTSPLARGAAVALAGWTKFAPLVARAPLGLLPRAPLAADVGLRRRFPCRDGGGVRGPAARAAARSTPPASSGTGRSAGSSGGTRRSRSGTGASTSAGLPDLHVLQWVLEGLLVAGAIAAYFVPRRKSPLQLAALTAALLLGFELVLTHWFYLYMPWFFPFAAFAVLAPAAEPVRARVREPVERPRQELVGVE